MSSPLHAFHRFLPQAGRAVALAGCAALALSACGGDTDPSTDASSASTSAPASSASVDESPDDAASANPGWRVTVKLGSETLGFGSGEVSVCEAQSGSATIKAMDGDNSISVVHGEASKTVLLVWEGTTWTSEGVPADAVQYMSNASDDMVTGLGTVADGSGNTTDIGVTATCFTLDEEG